MEDYTFNKLFECKTECGGMFYSNISDLSNMTKH